MDLISRRSSAPQTERSESRGGVEPLCIDGVVALGRMAKQGANWEIP